jgi:hypothetical protein
METRFVPLAFVVTAGFSIRRQRAAQQTNEGITMISS